MHSVQPVCNRAVHHYPRGESFCYDSIWHEISVEPMEKCRMEANSKDGDRYDADRDRDYFESKIEVMREKWAPTVCF